jgi:excisionase family DNA binding protein
MKYKDSTRLISVREAAKTIPCDVAVLRSMIREGRFPAVRIGKQLRVDPLKLNPWINKGGVGGEEKKSMMSVSSSPEAVRAVTEYLHHGTIGWNQAENVAYVVNRDTGIAECDCEAAVFQLAAVGLIAIRAGRMSPWVRWDSPRTSPDPHSGSEAAQ